MTNKSIRIGGLFDDKTRHQAGSIWSKEGICPAFDTCQGGYREPLTVIEGENNMLAVRKLTPSECFILQGMTEEDYNKCKDMGISDSQLYKQVGNGLSSNVVSLIMEHLKKSYNPNYKCVDEKMIDAGYGVEDE